MGYNYYPYGYQNPYYSPQQMAQPIQQNQVQQGSPIWVQGEAGAKSYLVAPNNTVQLWDSESQTIYLKSADASGMPSMRVLDYTIRDLTPVNGDLRRFDSKAENITRKEFEALKTAFEALKRQVEGKGVTENESTV